MQRKISCRPLVGAAFAALLVTAAAADDDLLTGPQTEARFPPLVVPDGFRATLFACDPLVEYPSVIALGPRPGTLFVAHDYMTGLGVEIIRRDEIRLLEDTDQDGYADRSTVYADGFNSVQGLAFDGKAVFVMHAPYLTRVRDIDGDGVADERRDLLEGLGLPPEENSNRLHCANGVVVGHDGWLYLALGDRGCDTPRPEGDRLVFQQGGILRCRPDGTDLHVFSTGLRNIYDVALDAELNVFVRDNENDGGDYLIRVNHCFFGSDHGYPYHYYERPDEMMRSLAVFGRGSSAGGTTYLETQFPESFHESLYFCEWGRAVVRYPFTRSGSGFGPVEEFDFAAGADNDPYGFKPTDLVVDYDGSLLISDWCDGQRPKRGRGRIYRVTYAAAASLTSADVVTTDSSIEQLIAQLDAPGYYRRVAAQAAILDRGTSAREALKQAWHTNQLGVHGQSHAVWILAQADGDAAVEGLFDVVESNTDPRVVVQAIRAIGDLSDPVLASDRLDAGRGSTQIADRLARWGALQDNVRVLREIVIVLSRLKYADAARWLRDEIQPEKVDPALSHAMSQLLRRSGYWPAVLQLLDSQETTNSAGVLRDVALRAMGEQSDASLVDGLIERLETDGSPAHRKEYADLLSRICRSPPPWTYWGFRPGPRSANTVDWAKTEAIQIALTERLADPDHDVRAFVLGRIVREALQLTPASLRDWLREESNPEHVAAILTAISSLPPDDTRPLLEDCVRNGSHSADNRLEAFVQFTRGLNTEIEQRLLPIAGELEDGPVLAAVLAELGRRPTIDADSLLLANLDAKDAAVRAAAVRALTKRHTDSFRGQVGRMLHDPDVSVLSAAAEAAGVFEFHEHADRVLELAEHPDRDLQRECLVTLRRLDDPRAVEFAVADLRDDATRLAALAYLERFGSSQQLAYVVAASRASLDAQLQSAVLRTIRTWREGGDTAPLDEAAARVHGRSGMPALWQVASPVIPVVADALIARILAQPQTGAALLTDGAALQVAEGADARVALHTEDEKVGVWLATADVVVDEAGDIEFSGSSQGTLTVWLNGEQVFSRDTAGMYSPDADRFPAQLDAGWNRILVRVDGGGDAGRFHLRFRRRSSKTEHEQLIQQALSSRGNAERGREVFTDSAKSLCLKCHRMGSQGAAIGPDLTGVGARFSRVHILESILEPSRTIAPSYATVTVVLEDGRVLTGVKTAEDAETITIGDNQGNTHQISREAIETIREQEISTMPAGLEQRMTQREFLDLIEFLAGARP